MLCELEDVTRTYPAPSGSTPIAVLDAISLQLDAGESLAITGPSGCGKTTLLNQAATLDTPDSGTVRIEGQEVNGLDERALCRLRNRRIGIVFQQHYLLPQCTVLENVLVPTLPWPDSANKENPIERAHRLLERTGMADRLHHLPRQLSGGECQRVALVRALINAPSLLCADEPTGSLDRASSDALGDLLVELNTEQHTALLVVTHSPALASRMQRCLVLRDGKLTEPNSDMAP